MENKMVIFGLVFATAVAAQQPANPRQPPGATITMYAPEQHGHVEVVSVASERATHDAEGEP